MIMASERFGNIEDLSYKDDISLFSQIGEYSQMQPFKLDVFVLLVCLNGHGSLNINGVDYRVDAGKMFVCKPHIIVEKSSVSLDFECRGMALSSKFIDQLGRVADGGWDLGVFLGKNPVLSLSDDEISLFMQYYALLGSKITRSYCRHQDAVMQALFRAFMLEFFDIMDRHVKLTPPNFTSSEMLFRHFVEVLMADYPRQRSVEHYASRLCVTPKYLSAPSSTIVSMAFATIPFAVPFHPAWTAAISPLLGSHSNIGTQSAVNTPIATFGSRVTSASTSVGGVGGTLSITVTLVLWVCRAVTMCSVPSRVRRRLRQSSTCAGLSPVYLQQLNSE